MENPYVSKEQAIEQLHLWPAFDAPSDDWIRKALMRTGLASRTSTVTTSIVTAHQVPDHEKPYLMLLRRVARIAGATVEIRKFYGYCTSPTGAEPSKIEKRFAIVTFENGEKISVKLECENRNVRFMLEGGEDRLGKVRVKTGQVV